MFAHGRYHFWLPRPTPRVLSPNHWMGEPDLIIPNLVTLAGAEDYLQAIFQNVFPIAGGGNFYIGLCDYTPASGNGLADVTNEPGATGGYARQAVPRNATGWPTVSTVNGHKSIKSTTETFAASGADFDTAFTRAFLTDASSGTSGVLFSISGAISAAVTVADGQSFQMQYETFLGVE